MAEGQKITKILGSLRQVTEVLKDVTVQADALEQKLHGVGVQLGKIGGTSGPFGGGNAISVPPGQGSSGGLSIGGNSSGPMALALDKSSLDAFQKLSVSFTDINKTMGETNKALADLTKALRDQHSAPGVPTPQQQGQQQSGFGMGGQPQSSHPMSMPGVGGGMGGGMADQGLSIASILKGVLSTGASVATAGYNLWYEGSQSLGRTNLGAVRNSYMSRAEIGGDYENRYLESTQLNRPENLLKYRGDILGLGGMLGERGRTRALDMVTRELGQSLEISQREGDDAKLRGVLNAVTGGAQAAIGIGVGLMTGGAGVALGGMSADSGIGKVSQGIKQAYSGLDNEFGKASTGGAASTVIGDELLGTFKAGRYSSEAMAAARYGSALQVTDQVNALQEAELRRNAIFMSGASQLQQSYDVKKQGALMIGRHAKGGYEDYLGAAWRGESMPTPLLEEGDAAIYANKRDVASAAQNKLDSYNKAMLNIESTADEVRDRDGVSSPQYIGILKDRAQIRKKRDALLEEAATGIKGVSGEVLSSGSSFGSSINPTKSQYGQIVRAVEAGAAGYDAVQDQWIGKNKPTMARGAYQIMPFKSNRAAWYADTGLEWTDMNSSHKAEQDAFWEKRFLSPHLREAPALQKTPIGKSLTRAEAVVLNQLGHTGIKEILSGNATDFQKRSVVPQMATMVMNADHATSKVFPDKGVTENSDFVRQMVSVYGPSAYGQASGKMLERMRGYAHGVEGGGGAPGADSGYSTAVTNPPAPANPSIYRRDASIHELGMTRPEFRSRANQLGMYVNPADDDNLLDKTALLSKIALSGLGTFDTSLGNLGQLNAVRGGQDNTKALETALAQAVALGFDRSRMAQQFVTSISDLSGSMGITNTDYITKAFGTGLNLLGGGRDASGELVADERAMSQMSRGMQGYGAYTGRTDGLMGMVKGVSLISSGQTIGSGITGLMKMNDIQRRAAIDTLGGEFDAIADSNLRDYVLAQPGGGTNKEKMTRLRTSLVRATNLTQVANDRYVSDNQGGWDVSGALNKIINGNLNPKEREAAVAEFKSRYSIGMQALQGIDSEAGGAAAILRLTSANAISRKPADLQTFINDVSAKVVNAADVTAATGKDTSAMVASALFGKKIDDKDMDFIFKDGSSKIRMKNGKMLDKDMWDKFQAGKLSKDDMASVSDFMSTANRVELGVRTGKTAELQRPEASGVRIINFEDLAKEIVKVLPNNPKPAAKPKAVQNGVPGPAGGKSE